MLHIEQTGFTELGPCECCGSMSQLATGFIHCDEAESVGYQVHWTKGKIEKHGAAFYFILGRWGDGTTASDRFAVALRYRADAEATGFMIVDAGETSIGSHSLVGKALSREEVVGTPLAQEIFGLVDFIWLNDKRLSEITEADSAT